MFFDKYENHRKFRTPLECSWSKRSTLDTMRVSKCWKPIRFPCLYNTTNRYQTGIIPHWLTSPWDPDSDIEIRPQGTKASPGASGTEWWDCWHWDGDSYWMESKGMDLEVFNDSMLKTCFFHGKKMKTSLSTCSKALLLLQYPVNVELGWSAKEQGSTIEQC